ncbi:MAG TPA: hypothetical protein PKH78_02270 [Candidatus Obscuribacter sp.]|nr:hypothetical protein [Candidatus Obscuribacter sp.]
MNYEIHFVAPSSAASEVVRIVGESSQLDYRSWLLHSCYISTLRAQTLNETRLRNREAALEAQASLFFRIDIREFSKELDGVDMDEMGLCGFLQSIGDEIDADAIESICSTAHVSIGLCDGIYWSVHSKDAKLLQRIRGELMKGLPKLQFE